VGKEFTVGKLLNSLFVKHLKLKNIKKINIIKLLVRQYLRNYMLRIIEILNMSKVQKERMVNNVRSKI
jgi:hypothetical protein